MQYFDKDFGHQLTLFGLTSLVIFGSCKDIKLTVKGESKCHLMCTHSKVTGLGVCRDLWGSRVCLDNFIDRNFKLAV